MTDEKKENEFLKQENYFEGYQKNIDALKHNSEAVEADKLHYLALRGDDGQKLLDYWKEKILIQTYVNPHDPNIRNSAVYFEGFKQAYRTIFDHLKAHQQRIEAESKK